MTISELSVEGTASVKDEMGGALGNAARLLRAAAKYYDSDYGYDKAKECGRAADALDALAASPAAPMTCDEQSALATLLVAAAPSRDQVSMGALREAAMSEDLVKELRDVADHLAYHGSGRSADTVRRAADHIEAIRAENERLKAVLTKAKAFHDRDSGCNGFTADYEILRLEIDEALGVRSTRGTEP